MWWKIGYIYYLFFVSAKTISWFYSKNRESIYNLRRKIYILPSSTSTLHALESRGTERRFRPDPLLENLAMVK